MTYRLSAVLTAAVLAISAGTAAASSVDTPEGVVVQPSYGSIPASALANPDDPTYVPGQESPLEGVLPPARDEACSILRWEGSDWGPDHLIYSSSGGVGQSQDFDVDPVTGYLYAAFDTYHTTGDSIRVFRSTDAGVTWTDWATCYNTDGALGNAKVRVVTTGGNTWVCILCLYDETSGIDNLWMRRIRTDGSNATWEQIADDVIFADMDGDIGSSGYLYVTFVPDAADYNVYAARNALSGAGWVNNVSLFGDADTHPYPAIAAGTGGVVSVAFIDTRLTTNDEVRIKRSSNYGSSWLDSQQVSNNSGAASLDDPDIAHARGTSAWICVSFDFSSSNINLGYYYSTNSGSTWTYGTTFPNVEDEYAGSMRASKGTGHNTIAYNVDPGDIVNFAWSNVSDPSDFTDPVQINDQGGVSWGPTAGWLTEGSYSAVEYTRTSAYSLYFDSFNNTGISDGDVSSVSGIGVSPNPFMDVATISFSLDNGGPVRIEIFDMSGRLVTTLAEGSSFASGSHQVTWNGTASGAPVPGGVYICRMTSQGSTQSTRMVLAR